MRRLHYHIVDVFTNERFGGNPLAVFVNGRGVPDDLMQRIAKELNLSETTFILPPQDAANDWRIRIFTPTSELPMAGHPTIGTAFVLAREHLVEVSEANPAIRCEEKVGVIPVTFTFRDGSVDRIDMQQPNPTFGAVCDDRGLIASMLSLDPADLDDYPVQVGSTGLPFLFIPIKTLDAVQRSKVRIDLYEQVIAQGFPSGMFVFTRETVYPTSTVHSRMFAPIFGIGEDPATGSASGPLGGYLVQYGLVTDNPAVIVSEQGFEMGRPSYIRIEIGRAGDQINRVLVGGQCVYIGEGLMEL